MEFSLTLYIWGDELNPDDVTDFFKIEPITSKMKGGNFRRSDGKFYTAKTGLWALSTEALVESENLRDHLLHLRMVIGDKLPSLLKSGKGQDALLSIILTAKYENGYGTSEFDLGLDDINIIQKLGVRLNVSILY